MHHELKVRFDLLNDRLSQPGQQWLAFPDTPTIADLVNYPFMDEPTSTRLDLALDNWPALENWCKRMKGLEPVSRMYAKLETLEPTKQN
jgi:glutathione S-transferase